jgi:hypothetical protein
MAQASLKQFARLRQKVTLMTEFLHLNTDADYLPSIVFLRPLANLLLRGIA